MYLLASRQLRALAVPRIVSCLNLDQRTFEYKLVCLMLHTQIHLCIRHKNKTFISKHVHRQQYTTQKIAFNACLHPSPHSDHEVTGSIATQDS